MLKYFIRCRGKKTQPFCSCAAARWHREGKRTVSVKHLEDECAMTCSTSFPKAQLQKGEEAAVNVSCMVPSLVLPHLLSFIPAGLLEPLTVRFSG